VEVAEWILQMQQLTGCLKRRKEWTQWTSFWNSVEKKASSRCEPQLKEYHKQPEVPTKQLDVASPESLACMVPIEKVSPSWAHSALMSRHAECLVDRSAAVVWYLPSFRYARDVSWPLALRVRAVQWYHSLSVKLQQHLSAILQSQLEVAG